MKTIYFVRHGEAENNLVREKADDASIYFGANASLTDAGREQSKRIAERASHLPIQVIISSPFRRTKETAAIIVAKTGTALEYSDFFVERKNPSRLLGMRWLDTEVQNVQRAWEKAFYTDKQVEDGETFSEILQRAKAARSYLEKRPESHILVVTHGFFLRMFIGDFIFGDLFIPSLVEPLDHGMTTRNTGLTVVKYDPNPKNEKHRTWHLSIWNDHAHLG